MAAIMCELCGSNDVVKQGEYFVCQHCGTKYTVEDAKKLIGTVKIDNSDFVEKYLQNARRAKEKEDWDETEKYYNMVEQNDPNNIEAIFYSAFAKAKSTLLKDDYFNRKAAFSTFEKTLSIIDDNYDVKEEKENKELLQQMSADLLKMTQDYYVPVSDPTVIGSGGPIPTTEIMFFVSNYAFAESLWNITQKFPQSAQEGILYIYKEINKHLTRMTEYWSITNHLRYKECIEKAKPISTGTVAILKEHDVTAATTSEKMASIDTSKSGGCYVATAVYGSYDCPQVWTLRRYRDYTLAESWFGRLFIGLYYAISPTLVRWFGETQWFKNMWKPKLDKMVKRLNEEGVADTPYQDRQW